MNTVSNLIAGKYELIKSLGEGAFGKADLVQDQQGNEYAVKKLTFFSSSSGEMAIAKRKFHDEVKILQKLNHPQIPKFVDYQEENQELYLVQQYIDGETLRAKLDGQKKFSIEEADYFLREILNILDYIHKQWIIHRDIKPDNIMIDNDGKLFLIDFGAAKEIIPNSTKLQAPGTIIHTPGYAPSEQSKGFANFHSDIYALGMTIIELITGLKPDDFGNDWDNKIQIGNELKNVLCKMIDQENHKRYQSASDVIHDLQKQNSAKTIPIVSPVKTPDVDPDPVNEMIGFGMLFLLIFLAIFHNFMLPTFKNQKTENKQSLLIETHLHKSENFSYY